MPFLSLLGLSLICFCFDLVWNFCLICDPFLTSIVFLYCFRNIRVGLALWSVVDVDGGIVGGNLRLVHILVRVRITCPANHNTNNSSNLFNKGFWQKNNNKWLFCQVIVLVNGHPPVLTKRTNGLIKFGFDCFNCFNCFNCFGTRSSDAKKNMKTTKPPKATQKLSKNTKNVKASGV